MHTVFKKGTVSSQPIQTANNTAVWNMVGWVLKQQSDMEARRDSSKMRACLCDSTVGTHHVWKLMGMGHKSSINILVFLPAIFSLVKDTGEKKWFILNI